MDLALLGAAFLVALAALVFFHDRKMGVVLHTLTTAQPRDIPEAAVPTDLLLRVQALEKNQNDLYLAVADGIDHVDRNEKRVRGIVLGAKRRFEASDHFDPGVDAEADTLPFDDAERGGEEGVRLVPEALEPAEDRSAWSVVPGRVG